MIFGIKLRPFHIVSYANLNNFRSLIFTTQLKGNMGAIKIVFQQGTIFGE